MTHPSSILDWRVFRSHSLGGFTLTELLVTIGIVGVLSVLLLPALGTAWAKIQLVACSSNLRQIGTAMNLYANEHGNYFPEVYPAEDTTWRWKLKSYLGMPESSMGKSPLPNEAGVFVCPSFNKRTAANRAYSYVLNAKMTKLQTYWQYNRNKVPAATTIMVVEFNENTEQFIQWDASMAAKGISRRHVGTNANYLFVDGHVEALSETLTASDPRWYSAP